MPDDMPIPVPPVKVLIATLRARGVDAEAILIAVEALLDSLPTRGNGVTYNAKKQAEYRARKKAAAVTRVTTPLPTRTRAGGVVSSSSTDNPGKKEKKEEPTEAELRAELETVLDPEQAAAVVEHRQNGKSPMKTIRAARALAGKFAKCPDHAAAVETMLARDWIGIEPSWLENNHGRTTNGREKISGATAAIRALEKYRTTPRGDEPPDPNDPTTIEGSFTRRDH